MIRKLQKTDREELTKLFREFHAFNEKELYSKDLAEFKQYKNVEEQFQKDTDEYINSTDLIIFVAEENGTLVGYACAKIKQKPERIFNKEAFVEDWFVSENYRDRGIGEQLFDALTAEAKKQRCTHLYLDAFATNKKAIAIYKKFGFKEDYVTMYKKI